MAPHAESPTRLDGLSPSTKTAPLRRVFPSAHLPRTNRDDLHDLICVGFGPASLAVAVALHDAMDSRLSEHSRSATPPKVAFLERQSDFAWHAGMQLPGAKMQISWIKDLATLRDPRSHFTFLNYLHNVGRLVQFTNLGTFLPARFEYEDYMRWCAEHFTHLAHYGQECVEIEPQNTESSSDATSFVIHSRNVETGEIEAYHTRHVVIAVGGRPNMPAFVPKDCSRVLHSSSYHTQIPRILSDPDQAYRVLVVGAGQSAAEIFHDLHKRYPHSHTSLAIRGSALKPSDDSPFVNETFDPDHVDDVFKESPEIRAAMIAEEKATNYGVVRLELLERIYEDLYEQRVRHPDPADQQHNILRFREVVDVEDVAKAGMLKVRLQNRAGLYSKSQEGIKDEFMFVDAVIFASGYVRNTHEELLSKAKHLRCEGESRWSVGRDYRVNTKGVSKDAGVWLQGCNEGTHGLSDSLLSILAIRGGELVESIFGQRS